MLVTRCIRTVRKHHRNLLDYLIQYKTARWLITAALCLFYFERSYGMNYYIVTYLIGFYVLQLIVKYVTPKGLDQDENEEEDYEEQSISTDSSISFQPYLTDCRADESRPITPSMSEMQVWERLTYAFTMGTICTCFKLLEIDVFWPMLVVYFLLLAAYTIRKVFKQMVKHNYGFDDFVKHPPM